MSGTLLKLYHRMPAPLRSAAATWRGRRLRSRRYGPETERLVAEALEREHWGPERWQAWRQERLGLVLRRAATTVPYYREQWAARRRAGDHASWEYLENWPILDKEPLRENARAFVAEDCDPRRMIHIHTSGTTGTSLDLWRSTETERAWYALFEARCRRWYGVSRRNRWAMLGGQLVSPAGRSRPPFWVWNAALKQLYMSSYHLAPELANHYLDALRRYRVEYLYGYTSSLYELALAALRSGRRDLRMAVALTNAEPVFDYQRRVIEEAFQCPVRETYGMAELAAAASECPDGRLHAWPEVSVLEVIEDGKTASAQGFGHLLCTGLQNPDMPLIRYRVGDRLRPPGAGEACGCGRTLPLLGSVEGRIDDVLYTAEGRRIGRLDPVFKSALPIREAQVIQETLDRVRVRYVAAPGFSSSHARSLTELLRERMGKVEVVLEAVDKVPRGANGKFRAVVCALPEGERRRLRANAQ